MASFAAVSRVNSRWWSIKSDASSHRLLSRLPVPGTTRAMHALWTRAVTPATLGNQPAWVIGKLMTQAARARIALINDDKAYLQLMEDLLQAEEGYEVLVCKVSNEAYEFVKEQRPDLILLDIRMETPEAGWTVLELLTLDPQTRDIPMIVCSAAIGDLQQHEGLLNECGVDVLPKPFDLDALLEKVEAGLTKRRTGLNDGRDSGPIGV
jgi:CheY-like chemotaxis protein